MAKIRRCCVAGCSIKQGDTVLYSFPNPVTDSCRFLKWVTATGNPELLKQKPEQVRKSRKICQLHFSSEYIHVRNLNQLAYPSLHMPETLNLPANWFDISTDLKENAENVNIEPTAEYWPLTFSTVFEEVTSLPENPAIPRDVPDFAGTSIPLMSAQENVISIENSAITSSSTTATMFGIDGRPSLTPSTSTTESAENKIKNSNRRKKGVYWVSRNDQIVIRKLKQRVSYYQRQNMILKKKLALVVKGSRNIYKRQFKSYKIRSQPRRFAESNEILPSTSLKQNRCYRLLSSLCALPSVTTSRKFLSKIPIYPGIIHQVFISLRDVVKNLNMQERFCSLIFDEMFIQPHLQYRSSKGMACNPSDEGHARKLEIANQVQVFMLHGIFSSWKQPVAYICGTTNSVTEIVYNYKLIIKEAHSAGFTVIASICGQRSANVRAIRMLLEETRKNALQKNMTIEDDVISIDGNIIVPIFDPSHLLKCMRNNLLSKDLTFYQDDISKTAKWTHIMDAYHIDLSNRVRSMPKLTDCHILPHKINKTKLTLCVQVFSRNVSATIELMSRAQVESRDKKLKMGSEAQDTADLCFFFNELFDSLNVDFKSERRDKLLRGAVSTNSRHKLIWQRAIRVLESMKFVCRKPSDKPVPLVLQNFIFTVKGFQKLWDILLIKYKFSSFPTRSFRQDTMENIFVQLANNGN